MKGREHVYVFFRKDTRNRLPLHGRERMKDDCRITGTKYDLHSHQYIKRVPWISNPVFLLKIGYLGKRFRLFKYFTSDYHQF